MSVRLDHVGLDVADYEASRAFYEKALEPLGLHLMMSRSPVSAASVDAFHAAALATGGTHNGGPGTREIYHPNYYGAFVLDPDGNNVEAVCHTPG